MWETAPALETIDDGLKWKEARELEQISLCEDNAIANDERSGLFSSKLWI